jgi:hypothetical protein
VNAGLALIAIPERPTVWGWRPGGRAGVAVELHALSMLLNRLLEIPRDD